MIEVIGLTKTYGNTTAVSDVSFSIDKGSIVGFLGPNGAGKSTTMNMITGYISMTRGSVKIDGLDILENAAAARKKIGYLPEVPPLYPNLTVYEYLNFAANLKQFRGDKRSHIDEICRLVGLSDVQKILIKNLSKGYKQRVGLAQALIGYPEILILDEPTVGLDPLQIVEIRNVIKNLAQKCTIIISSHILSEIQAVCDRVIVINKGKIIADNSPQKLSDMFADNKKFIISADGSPEEVLNIIRSVDNVEDVYKSDTDFDYIIQPKDDIDVRPDVISALAQAGIRVLKIEEITMQLEDIFIKLTKQNEAALSENNYFAQAQKEEDE